MEIRNLVGNCLAKFRVAGVRRIVGSVRGEGSVGGDFDEIVGRYDGKTFKGIFPGVRYELSKL
jgi:hypothetical protein